MSLARLYLRTDRSGDAAAELAQVVRLEPNLAQAHYQLSRAYLRLKRDDAARAAIATYKRLSDRGPRTEREDLVRRLAVGRS